MTTNQDAPLSDIRILDFSHIAAGPYGTLQLAYFGAEVIKVESRGRPDGWRIRDGNAHIEASRPFADHNKNKLGLTLDLKHPQVQDVVKRLVARADVVLDNFSVGVMDRLGLGHDVLRREFPSLIVVSVPGLGSIGPHSHWVTWGPSIMPLSGLTSLWNHPHWPEPVGSQTSYPDYVVGAHVAALVLAALATRDVTGDGCWVDVSQAEVSATLLAPFFMEYLLNGTEPSPLGNRHPVYAPQGCYPCQGDDRWCVIAVTTDEEWRALCRVIGLEDWVTHPDFSTCLNRHAHHDQIDERIAVWTRAQAAEEVMRRCQDAGVPAGLVATGQDLAHDLQLQHRQFLMDTQHPYLPEVLLPGCPVALSRTPPHYERHAPLLGQDNRHVLCDLLGLSTEMYQELETTGVLR